MDRHQPARVASLRSVDDFFRCAQPDRPSLGRTEALLHRLADLTERCCDDGPSGPERLEPRLVRSAKDYLADNFADNIQLGEVAVAFGVNGFHLTRAFKKSTGLAMHAWLVQHRVERARAMLIRGTAPSNAAASCGFSDQPHMTRWFRRLLGMTPREVQRMSRTFKTAPFYVMAAVLVSLASLACLPCLSKIGVGSEKAHRLT